MNRSVLSVILIVFIAFGSQASHKKNYADSVFGSYSDYEHILSFHSDIRIQNNCKVLIVEKIKVLVQGIDIERGIYRDIPLSYKYGGINYHVEFKLLEVARDGRPEPYYTESLSNGIRIYIGHEDVFLLDGVYEYTIAYEVNYVLGFLDDRDELAWNVNGNDWDFMIDKLSARVYYPDSAELVEYTAYTGSMGDKGKDYKAEVEGNVVSFSTTRKMGPHENMTVAVGWSKNHLTYPSSWNWFIHWLKNYIIWVIGGMGLILGFIYNMFMWWKHGRDPKPGTIIPLFYPPEGFSPAECAYLERNGKATDTLFGSMLMQLAVKGHLKIDSEEGKGLFKNYSYTITRINGDKKDNLNELELDFLSRLFRSKDELTIKKGKYNASIKKAHDYLLTQLERIQKDRYYVRNAHLKGRQFLIPLATLIGGIVALSVYGGYILVLIAWLVLHAIMNVIFSKLYEQPTRAGRKKMDEIDGFKMYMEYANKERIRLMNPPTMNFQHFEENLPYAIALGVAEEWQGQFEPEEIQDFTSGHVAYMHGVGIASLSDFSSNLSKTISSAKTPPSTSGSGGGSSYSGGGGYSGGGFGGGGGGGW